MKIVAHDIEGLAGLIKSGLFGDGLDCSFHVIDVSWSRSNRITQMQLTSYVDSQLVTLVNSDLISCACVQDLHLKHGFGCKTEELMAIAYSASNSFPILTDDKGILKVSYSEGVMTYSYNEILELILDLNFDNEKLLEIKKSGRKPT